MIYPTFQTEHAAYYMSTNTEDSTKTSRQSFVVNKFTNANNMKV